MALSEIQQIFELIKKTKSILIITKEGWAGDCLAASLALAQALKRSGKQADVVCQGFKASANLSFLPTGQVQDGLKNLQRFVISVNTDKTPMGEFFYDRKDGQLNIYLTPSEGKFTADDVATASEDYKYGLIIIIGAPDLESLGSAYEDHSDFFYGTPKINIDCSPANESYGDINLVNVAMASVSEIVYDLIKQFDERLIDEDAATYLLSGIIMATKNFKTTNLTPATLNTASRLVSAGGRREQILRCLYQNRFVSTLKLWGRVLSRLNSDLDDRLVWSVISANDFLETSTTPEEIDDVADELIVSMSKTEIIALIHELREGEVTRFKCLLYTIKNNDALMLAKKFNPTGNRGMARFEVPAETLAQAEKVVIDEIKSRLNSLI